MRAEETVYRDNTTGQGYVGRHPVGSMTIVAKRGAELSADQVEALGLSDLADHTDYDAILAKAVEDGAEVSARVDGEIKMVPAAEAVDA